MALLTINELNDVVTAMTSSGINTTAVRPVFFQYIDPRFVGTLNDGFPPLIQLKSDLGRMNTVERLANGDIPLQFYLQNAAFLMSGLQEEKIIRNALDLVTHRANGVARPDPAGMPETKEAIIHMDDTVSFNFMANGARAGSSVMKLKVPAYENGQPRPLPSGSQMIALGTGWLLSDSLLMTNHHVINARKEGEPVASEADLRLQGQKTIVIPDYDSETMELTEFGATALEAWSPQLDYAIIRIPSTNRTPLRRSAGKIVYKGDPVPVNIIQHPNGRSKRYGIRNNLVSASTETELRYFTDTDGGSSGSPVMNDNWEVVALHRASTYVQDVQFQGKPTAYVNLGTHLSLITDDLKQRYVTLAGEIGL